MYEASKTRKLLLPEETALLIGKGIDIGCGEDPVTPDCQRFDVEDGDANKITNHIIELESYDYVFSAHCLEHMYLVDCVFSLLPVHLGDINDFHNVGLPISNGLHEDCKTE